LGRQGTGREAAYAALVLIPNEKSYVHPVARRRPSRRYRARL